MNKKALNTVSRRGFINTSAAAIAGFTIVPRHAVAGLGHTAPGDKLNVACVGIGGMGRVNIENVSKTENIVALCDVDWRAPTLKVFGQYPRAKQYKDYRVMLDKQRYRCCYSCDFRPYSCCHQYGSYAARQHVFTQKPLTHTVYEARALAKAAKEFKVATQMGNRGRQERPDG